MTWSDAARRASAAARKGKKKPPHRASVQGGQHFGDSSQHTGGTFGRGEPPKPKYPNRGRT